MDRIGRGTNRNRLKTEKGYVLMSTLFFLVFTGIFTQMLIQISGNHIIQLRQFSEAYQAKTALNMSESILKDYIETNETVPSKGTIQTSIGPVQLQKMLEDEFLLKVTLSNGVAYQQLAEIKQPIKEDSDEDIEEDIEEDVEDEENLENVEPDAELDAELDLDPEEVIED